MATAVSKFGDKSVQLSYRQLEATLAAYLGVHPDRMGTFRSRLKQLQRLEFPPGVNIGRGVRMTYSATHLLQLAVAFELVGTGLAAKTATDLAMTHWPKFEAAFGRAYSKAGSGGNHPTFVRIPARPPVEPLKGWRDDATVEDEESLLSQWTKSDMRAAVILIEASKLLERINRLAEDVAQERYASGSPEYRIWSEQRKKDQELFDNADGGPLVPF